MKLITTFDLTSYNVWRITINVADCEDFPTKEIFRDVRDYPSNPDYTLFPNSNTFIVNYFKEKSDAEDWEAEQLKRLKVLLHEWRTPTKTLRKTHYI